MHWRSRWREAAFCWSRSVCSAIRSRSYSRNPFPGHSYPMPDAPSSDQDSGKTAVLHGFLALADAWVAQKADDRGVAWFRGAIHDVAHAANERALGVAIGLVPRRLG